MVRFLIIKFINFMRGTLTLLKGLPRYEVFLEEAKHFPGLDASACYTFLQLLRTGDELLALDEQVLAFAWDAARSIQSADDAHEMHRGPGDPGGSGGQKPALPAPLSRVCWMDWRRMG